MLSSFLGDSFLILHTIMLTFAVFASTSGLKIPLAYSHKRSPGVCRTEECLVMDKNWLEKIDLKVNPCQDFYQFACGKHNDEKEEMERAQTKVTQQLIQMVKEPVKKTDHKILKLVKEMYQSCLKHGSGAKDLRDIIMHIGGWILFDTKCNEADFSLDKFFAKAMEVGYFPKSLFTISVSFDPTNKVKNIITIKPKKQEAIGLMKDMSKSRWPFNLAVDSHDAYIPNTFMPKFAAKMNVDRKKAFDDFNTFATVKHLVDETDREPRDYKSMKLSEIRDEYKNIPWPSILNAVFKPIQIPMDENIIVDCPRCLDSLNDLLGKTSKRGLISYVMWSFVFEMAVHGDDEMFEDWLKLEKIDKDAQCANTIFSMFRRVLDYEYVTRYFDKKIIPSVSTFIDKCKSAMEEVIRNTDMMDPVTRGHAITKVKEMVFVIGYDDEISSEKKLQQYYAGLNVNPKSYLLALLGVLKFETEKTLGILRKSAKIPYCKSTNGNAIYYHYFNTVFLSVNVLTGALYARKNRPEYLNYGALGDIITHEMNHAFDFLGYQLDKRGQKIDWWKPVARAKHWQKIECLVEQYSEFTNVETGNKVDGYKTLSENLADIGGVEVSYKAYEKSLLKNGNELVLPSFQQFTARQLFWITYATVRCEVLTKERVLDDEIYDSHAKEHVRVNAAAINSEVFARDWQCKLNTPMNPGTRCTFWK